MAFDAVRYCQDNGIPYWTEGKNVSSSGDFVNIQCVFCEDNSNHLGIYKAEVPGSKPYTKCWKCGKHSLYDLLKIFSSGIPYRQIIDKYKIILEGPSNFRERKVGAPLVDDVGDLTKTIVIPGTKPLPERHRKYLEGRKYDPDYLEYKYDLRGTDHTDKYYDFRIIAPVYYQNKIVTFQGRTILGKKYTDYGVLRYKACDKDFELIHHKYLVYNIDNCFTDSVIVVEGLPSVWRIGDNCVATFGTGFTTQQINLLAQRFRRVYTFYDPERTAQTAAMEAGAKLESQGVEVINLRDPSVEDPGEMEEEDVVNLKRELYLL